ncbi:helix-turn-helix transcriptional regulator [Brevibacillus choshinensis]|uniref:helix-turn-helix domain-containing protein n=1 Tax=Brevibacillus choshinensis TaxID=54911 RepID=UPI002E1B0C68|nr:helix-turn-helix transcriptional regulator [Brevibacillus choshinensis]
MSVISMGFKERLKELRTKKGLTQEALAASLDIPESTIRRLESSDEGLPRRERLEKIADFFDVQIDYLLGRTDAPSPSLKQDKPVNRAFLELPEGTTEEEKEFLQAQLDLQLEMFRKLKGKNKN